MASQQSGSLAGKRVGKYTLDKLLGSGATGEVYRASARGGKNVAVKILAPELVRDPDGVARFQREAEVGQKLDHPHVARVLDVGSSRGRYFIVMELLRSGVLRKMIARGDKPHKVIVALSQVAEALAYAHGQGVVHRDLKPENVLLTRSGQAKVADFGLARVADSSGLTTDGAMLGTAKYMSPEQARGEKADDRSDVYSFGVMLYEVVSGDLPFDSVTQHGFIFQHVAQKPKKPRVRPGFSPALGKLAMRCLTKEPAGRPTMDEVAGRMSEAADWRPSRWRLVAALGVVALLAGVTLVLARPHVLDPLADGWFGAPLFRELRAAALAVREFAP